MELTKQQILHKKIIYTFAFGVTWGLIEIFLNSLFISTNLYLRGIIFSVAAVFILLFSKRFADYKFSLLFIAALALIIKSAAGSISLNYIIALFAQALIAEIMSILLKNKTAAVVLGGLIVFYSFIHSLIFHGSLPGEYIAYLYNHLFESFTGISASADMYFIVLSFFGIVGIIAGVAAGWLSYKFTEAYKIKIENSIERNLISE